MLGLALLLAGLPAMAQQGTINPRIPPPPPPPEQAAPEAQPKPVPQPSAQPNPPVSASSAGGGAPATPESNRDAANSFAPGKAESVPPPDLPAMVVIPAGTRITVVLDTPLSTRIARQGQLVTFRTSEALRVHDRLEIPPETAFTGTVVEVKRPGSFGKAGALKVRVDRINLSTGATASVVARLDSPDMKAQGRLASDNTRGTDLYRLAVYSLEGTLVGAQISGGKGAAIGAGAGATVALIILMSRRGPDVYLEPGMPFLVILDQNVELPAAEVFTAQQSYARSRWPSGDPSAGSASGSGRTGADSNAAEGSEIERNPEGAVLDSERPKLKRRPKKPQP